MPWTLGAQSVAGIPSFGTQLAVQYAMYACSNCNSCSYYQLEAVEN